MSGNLFLPQPHILQIILSFLEISNLETVVKLARVDPFWSEQLCNMRVTRLLVSEPTISCVWIAYSYIPLQFFQKINTLRIAFTNRLYKHHPSDILNIINNFVVNQRYNGVTYLGVEFPAMYFSTHVYKMYQNIAVWKYLKVTCETWVGIQKCISHLSRGQYMIGYSNGYIIELEKTI